MAAAAAAFLLAGCQSLYFDSAGAPPPPRPLTLADWPDREYWSAVVFNGQRIGFSRLSIGTPDAAGIVDLRSQSAFALRFLGFDKRIDLKAHDRVRADLDLVSFRYEYTIDGQRLDVSGERRDTGLEVTIGRGDAAQRETFTVPGPLRPAAAALLLPSIEGLAPGREWRYPVFSGELRQVTELRQRVVDYERSQLFEGSAYRVETEMAGYRVTTWISPRGAPLLELAMSGVLVSGLEDESRAKRALAEASLAKAEAMVDFALVRVTPPIADARAATTMRVTVRGVDRTLPTTGPQRCTTSGSRTSCSVDMRAAVPAPSGAEPRHLASTFAVPASDPAITTTAREIVAGTTDPESQVRRLVEWIGRNVRVSPADVWSATDVLRTREAECQGHTYLYAAFARSLGIPTRVANGLVYSVEHQGFLYHTWAESLVHGRWLAVDPTFGSVPADATHLEIVEGESLADLGPLADWIGRVELRVEAVGYGR